MGRLRWHDWLLTVGAVALAVLLLFLDWFSITGAVGDFGGEGGWLQRVLDDGGLSAWQAFETVDLVLAATVLAAVAYLGSLAAAAPAEVRLAAAGIVTGLAFAATVMVAIRIATPPSLGLAGVVSVSVSDGVWLGLLACCLLTASGALALGRARHAVAST